MVLVFEIVEDSEPDPEIENLLDYMVYLSRISDTYYLYIGNPAPGKDPGQTP